STRRSVLTASESEGASKIVKPPSPRSRRVRSASSGVTIKTVFTRSPGGDGSGRELDGEDRAAAGAIGRAQPGAVRLGDAGRDGQAQTGAALLRGEERLEDLFEQLGRDAGARVADAHRHVLGLARHRDG